MLEGKTILAPVQMEANGCIIHDRIMGLNSGEQPYIQTPEGLRIPMYTYQGLMYINVRPVQDGEWGKLPHVYLTADTPWDPSIYDHGIYWIGRNWIQAHQRNTLRTDRSTCTAT